MLFLKDLHVENKAFIQTERELQNYVMLMKSITSALLFEL